MVATTHTLEHAMIMLTTIELMLGDLPEVAAEWNGLADGERASWSIEWDNEMAGLEHLSRLAATGALTLDLYSRYQQVIARLAELSPHMKRLRLTVPPMLTVLQSTG